MAIYCMSDIHGRRREFFEMLDKIGFSDDDELWILGDIIDRGAESAEMLVWAVDEAPANVHFLLGNHEDMAYSVIARDPEGLRMNPEKDLWFSQHGVQTAKRLKEVTDAAWRASKLVAWLENLELFHYLEVGGKPFMLVHAGFEPSAFDKPTASAEALSVMPNSACTDPGTRQDMVDVGHGFGVQYAQDMLWARNRWLFNRHPAPCDTVFGHTYLKEDTEGKLATKGIQGARGGSGRIVHIFNRHDLDCGCANVEREDMPSALACLRLDDMAEFYVDIPYAPDPDELAMKEAYAALEEEGMDFFDDLVDEIDFEAFVSAERQVAEEYNVDAGPDRKPGGDAEEDGEQGMGERWQSQSPPPPPAPPRSPAVPNPPTSSPASLADQPKGLPGNLLSKEEFVELLDEMRDRADLVDDYDRRICEEPLLGSIADFFSFAQLTTANEDKVVSLLAKMFEDYDADIARYCYELDFGREWKSGMIAGPDGEDVELSDASHLYGHLVMQMLRRRK